MKLQTQLTLITLASLIAIASLNTAPAQADESVKIVAHYEITSIDKAEDHFCQSWRFDEIAPTLKHLFLVKTALENIEPVFCPVNDVTNKDCKRAPIKEAIFMIDERNFEVDIVSPAKISSSRFSTSMYPSVFNFHSEQNSPISADGYNAQFGRTLAYDVVILEKRSGAIKLELTESLRESNGTTDGYTYTQCQNGALVNHGGWVKFKATLRLAK